MLSHRIPHLEGLPWIGCRQEERAVCKGAQRQVQQRSSVTLLLSLISIFFFFFFLHTEPPDYQGARTARAIVDGSLAELPNFSVKVVGGQSTGKAKNVDEFLASNPTLPKALLFTTKSSTAPLFKALSVDFNNR